MPDINSDIKEEYTDLYDWSFLAGFEQRMGKFVLPAVLLRNSEYKQDWSKRFGVDTVDAQLEIMLVTILYMFRRSLQNIPSTVKDTASMLYSWNRRFGGYRWSEEDAEALVRFMMFEVFYNSDSSRNFISVPQYGEDPESCGGTPARRRTRCAFIDMLNDHPELPYSEFTMTEEGLRCILASLEYQNSMSITEQTLLTKARIASQDYESAEHSIMLEQQEIRVRCRILEDTARQYRQNIDYFEIEKFYSMLEQDERTVRSVIDEVSGMRTNLLEQIDELEKAKECDEDLSSAFRGKDLKKLMRMQKLLPMLSDTLNMLTELVARHNEIGSVVREQINSYLTTAASARLTVKQAIGQPVLENPDNIEMIPELLAPLFFGSPSRIYNPVNLFCGMKISDPEEEPDETFLEIDVEEERRKQKSLEKDLRKGYQAAVGAVVASVHGLGGKASLAQIKSYMREHPELADELFSRRDTGVVVLQSMLTAGDGEVVSASVGKQPETESSVLYDRDSCIRKALRRTGRKTAGIRFSRIDEPDLVLFYLPGGERVSCTDFGIELIRETREENADDI